MLFEKKISKKKILDKLKQEKQKSDRECSSWDRFYSCRLSELIKWVGEN